jgi:DnaJ-class molecular chaperone
MEKSHYERLGINERATKDEIKKAYRSLSLLYHPDRNQNKETIELYKQINESYEILKDDSKRKQYDNELFYQNQNIPSISQLFTQSNLFEKIFEFSNGPQMNENIFFHFQQNEDEDEDNPFPHQNPFVHLCNHLQKPPPIQKNIQVTLQQIFLGDVVPLEIERVNQNTKETVILFVDIQKGMDDQSIVYLKNEGSQINSKIKGDVHVTVTILTDDIFIKKKLDLYYKHTISLKEALCGFHFSLPHLNGQTYLMDNSKGIIIHPSFKKTIPKLGFSNASSSIKGNLIIEFNILFPIELLPEQIQQLQTIL